MRLAGDSIYRTGRIPIKFPTPAGFIVRVAGPAFELKKQHMQEIAIDSDSVKALVETWSKLNEVGTL